jgi:phosphatidylglycerol---prolipoprotein diacylglyceryl transferase
MYESALALPYFHLGAIGPIQAFGVIVAVGVLIGAGVLRRYAEWHGISDDHIRGLTGWVTITGFIGAHVFDVLFYQFDAFEKDPLLIVMIWKGISSYGGFLGGAIGWWIYVWWKRLPMRVVADVTVLGLLVAFSIGRIGCTVVSDHIGAAVDPNQWYAALAMDYPRHMGELGQHYTELTGPTIRAWNLGLLEFLYLVPVNAFILWYAFRAARPNGTDKAGREQWLDRHNAGMPIALTGLLYAPVRFFMDYLRFSPESDPRYFSLTFAQWISIVAFGASIALLVKIAKNGKPGEPVTRTAGEAQARLKMILKDDEDKSKDTKAGKAAGRVVAPAKAVEKAKEPEADEEDDELAKEAEAASAADVDDDEGDEDEDDAPAAAAKPATKPAGTRPRPAGGGSSKKNKKKKRR